MGGVGGWEKRGSKRAGLPGGAKCKQGVDLWRIPAKTSIARWLGVDGVQGSEDMP